MFSPVQLTLSVHSKVLCNVQTDSLDGNMGRCLSWLSLAPQASPPFCHIKHGSLHVAACHGGHVLPFSCADIANIFRAETTVPNLFGKTD